MFDIPNKPTFTSNVPYTSVPGPVSEFTRIAYYMQLIDYQGISQWVWVSMDAFTDDISKIGVPNVKSAAVFQQEIYNLTVASSIASLNGYDGTGNIEFWPNDYGPNNKKEVPGASSSKFDWGDERSSSGSYGSMQVHATNLKSTIFAFNRWNRNEAADIGIGNRKYDHPDWTFASNAEDYVFKRIEVFVKNPSAPTEAPTTSPTSAQTPAPSEEQQSDCTDTIDNVCDPGTGKCKSCKRWKNSGKCDLPFVWLKCPESCGKCVSRRRLQSASEFDELVVLIGADVTVKFNEGEEKFNELFAACPVVQYIRNDDITAVYKRIGGIPTGFNAYQLFTTKWESKKNVLNQDFELYDNMADLMNDEDKWTYCNYNGMGFPGNCGKTGYTSSRWFSMPDRGNAPYLKQGASLAVHSAEGCPIDELVSRNNATDINNYACKRMALHPQNGIKSYYGSDRIVQWPESCTVEAKVEIGGSCDGFCSSFKSMFCVGAHGDTNAFFDDGLSVGCDANHTKEFAACQCATNMTAEIEEDEHASKPTSNACINLAFGGDFTKHQIYEYCDSEPSTCTVNINAKATGATCSEFCTSHEDMVCLSASEANRYERLQCASGKKIECDDSSGQDYIQCECGIVMGSERVETLKRGPVLRENTQDYCPAYTTVGNNDHANERSRRYQKVTLTLGVNDDESDGSIPVVAAKMVPDLNNNNLDSYNTQDVEVCDGLEYTKKNDDPPESCSFGHRFDSKSNCYGKLEMNFENASQKCAARGGHLLRLDDEEEFDKLNKVFRRQRFSIGMHSDGTSHGMEWDGYPGCKVDIEKDLSFLKVNTRSDINHDCWELNLDTKQMYPHSCTDTRTWICEGKRPSEKRSHRKECTSDSVLVGDGGDLKRDEGGFCLFYLEDPKLTLPDDESGGFRNTELAHFLSFSPETRTRKYYLEYGHLVDAEFRGYYENDHNWDDLILSSIGINSTDPIMDIDHETDDFHCHFSPTNFGISRIYLQQHMLERIYPGAFKKHCFCGYKHLGKLVSRCDCTKNGVRNNNCQKEHRPMLYEATYKENGEYVYCNNGQCDQASP